MKFNPRFPSENVNVSQFSPWREFFKLIFFISGLLLLIYFMLGLTLELVVEKLPFRIEAKIEQHFNEMFKLDRPLSGSELFIQELMDSLIKNIPDKHMQVQVRIVKNQEINALALPGNNIIVTSALLDEIESENELAMVLGHELGHIIHRDHLKGLGRGLVLVVLVGLIFGPGDAVTEFMQNMLLAAEFKFSRRQEISADKFALELLYRKYGQVAGAIDFFERLRKKDKIGQFLRFFSTHPYPLKRIRILQKEIERKAYPYDPSRIIPLRL